MNIGILIFAYNRSRHLTEVLNGLKKNSDVEKVHIFQDGLKCEEHRLEWEKTKTVIGDIDWCEVVYHKASYNKGLAQSIVDGINLVFEEYDAVIVLEDDCVPTANFISFMNQCFEKYKDNKEVYCVSGYSWPIALEKGQYDVYGCGRISSWGWGTWKDRWIIYEKDYELVKKMKQEEITSKNLAMWGQDLEEVLIGNVRGNCDSWAVFWALNVISKEGICINPYESLIRNIGMDGSGVHCGTTNRFEVKSINGEIKEFNLPEQIDFLDEAKEAFASLYGSYTASSHEDETKDNILVYGLGNFYLQNERETNKKYNIKAFVDRNKRGWFVGKKIIKLNEIKDYTYDYILIMIQDIQECLKVSNELSDLGINSEKILLGNNLFGDYK